MRSGAPRTWVTPLFLNTIMPYMVLVVSVILIISLIVLADLGSVIPRSYVCNPWSEEAFSNQLNLRINSFKDWFFLNVILFIITFLYGIIHKGTSFWTWDQSNYYRLSKGPESTRVTMPGAMPFLIELPVMAFGGELLVTTFGYVGLLFSFVHYTYLLNTVLARGCVILVLSAVKRSSIAFANYVPLIAA